MFRSACLSMRARTPSRTIRLSSARKTLIVPGGCASLWSIYPVLAYRGRGPPDGPAEQDASRHADGQGGAGEGGGLPANRGPDLPPGEADDPQDGEIAAPPPDRGQQQVNDGHQGQQAERHPEQERQVLDAPEV